MSKAKTQTEDPDILPEYDFSRGVRGKYYERFRRSSNVVVLDPDVAKAFPNSEAVNAALRSLADGIKRSRSGKRASARRKRPNNEMKLTKPAKR
jgi:hypothetical protein